MDNVGGARILLAEDNAIDAEMTKRALRKAGVTHEIVWVRDGAEAMDWLQREGPYAGRDEGVPRLVLLDLKMPKMDGIEVLQRMKSDERLRAIPVVMLTSSAEERDLCECYRLGVNSYLVKPVEFSAFMDQISRAGWYWSVLNAVPKDSIGTPTGG